MKKIKIILGIFLATVFLSGCGQSESDNNSGISESSNMASEIEVNVENGEESSGNLSEELKKMAASGVEMKCTYSVEDENGKSEVVSYVQGEKYKTEATINQKKTTTIFDGEVIYSWIEGEKNGTKMDLECVNKLGGNEADSNEESEPTADENEENFIETMAETPDIKCERFSGEDFSIPDNINFSDQCELLRLQEEMIKNFGNVSE